MNPQASLLGTDAGEACAKKSNKRTLLIGGSKVHVLRSVSRKSDITNPSDEIGAGKVPAPVSGFDLGTEQRQNERGVPLETSTHDLPLLGPRLMKLSRKKHQ